MRILFILLFSALFFFQAHPAYAKVLPQAKGTKVAGGGAIASRGVTVSARLRADRRAIIISFGNLQNATNVTYALTYSHDGQQEGASGSITPRGEPSATRELLFGTCSKDVCRYHSNVVNAKLEVTTQLSNGKKSIKRFRIRA